MNSAKIGDKVRVVEGYSDSRYSLVKGETHVVDEVSEHGTVHLQGKQVNEWYGNYRFELLESVPNPNFAAAFNAWMEDYIHNPQGYEDSYETAMRHVSEKLKGEEASYGQVAAEVFQTYLDKLEDK